MTYEAYLPFGGRLRFRASLEEDLDGTRFSCRFGRVQGRNPIHTGFLRVVMGIARLQKNLRRSNELLEAELRTAEEAERAA